MDFIDIIPIVRMLFSTKSLVSVTNLVSTETKSFETIDAIKAEGFELSDRECIYLDGTVAKKQLLLNLKESIKGGVKAAIIKGHGAIVSNEFTGGSNAEVAGRIIIVTGGAQGFGGGVAEELFDKGAHVVIADLNEEVGQQMADKLNSKGLTNRAVFVKVNVGDSESVKTLVEQTVLQLGGVDAIISNAGILRAGGLDEMDPDTFDLMTKVNYAGYFYCAKHASRIMKLQSEVCSDHFMDIIQINSKSGLKGSNRNFAYAGGKFGGIGLTQSFALELMPNNIKVNSICPGNFFDGPLWSDPEKGLFVQYLNAGKVPGAKTVSDVQAFYEKQVPAGRGCRVNDVTKAILYVIDQDYETGQAIPVTGGQEMLK